MAGGTWTKQNKVRPGAYINTKGTPQPKPDTSIGRTLLIGSQDLNWGVKGITEVDTDSDFKALFGTTLADPKLLALRETLKGALTVLYLNNNDGVKAKVEDAALPWNFKAKYAGTKGNDLTISIEKDPNDETLITVNTLFGTEIVDQQQVRTTTAQGLESNTYVDVTFTGDNTEPTAEVAGADGGADFSATAGKDKLEALTASSTYKLAGGTTEPADITDMLNEALATEVYQVVTTAGFPIDNEIHEIVGQAIKRLRKEDDFKARAVLPVLEGGSKYDSYAISKVSNGIKLANGEVIEKTYATGYFAGASSAANYNESLTYAQYPDAVEAYPKLSNEQTSNALNAGEIVFISRRDGTVVIEQDINSLVTFTDDNPASFRKNRIVRTLDEIANNTSEVFHTTFIGKVDNDPTGRDLFKANRVAYLRSLENAHAIRDFDPTDLAVDAGNDKDSILVSLAVTPVDAMEKLYMTLWVN
ncbi:phage tail sheath C-terminal domain-containing protein [Secundilactobacillus kimchicus]|uniref:phage tail sheath C-terminal domain-containing protein n=1 Tax=Secundilactobacillus kimchicus TaxID=528209 RepID=UPI0024A93858|nr:phage tail sheath C-terminal domain-containing protein [Secundilactobacillus kimchicus]